MLEKPRAMAPGVKRSALLAALAGAPVVLATGLSPAVAQNDAILISGTANDSGAEIFYAKDLGLFPKAGLPNVTVNRLNSPGAAAAAVIGGTLTVGTLTIPAFVVAKAKGLPIALIAPASLYNSAKPTTGIIVLEDSPIKSAAHLNGKTLATRDIQNLSYYGALAWIDKNGGDSKTVKWIEIDDPLITAAMQAHHVDAGVVSEPVLDDALNGGARLLAACDNAIGNHFLIAGYFTTADYAQTHPEIVRKISQVIIEAGVWGNSHHAESAKILEKYAGAPVPAGITRVTYAEKMRAADVVPILDLMQHYGILTQPMKPTALFAPEVALSS